MHRTTHGIQQKGETSAWSKKYQSKNKSQKNMAIKENSNHKVQA